MRLEALFQGQWCEVLAIYVDDHRHASMPDDDAMFVLPEGQPGVLVEMKRLPRVRVLHNNDVVVYGVRSKAEVPTLH